nr:MAG TPA: hypothetical protein [Caudoviricetes sp.]
MTALLRRICYTECEINAIDIISLNAYQSF